VLLRDNTSCLVVLRDNISCLVLFRDTARCLVLLRCKTNNLVLPRCNTNSLVRIDPTGHRPSIIGRKSQMGETRSPRWPHQPIRQD